MKLKTATLMALIGSLLLCVIYVYQLIKIISYSDVTGILFSVMVFLFSVSLVLFF
jgi:hypothetical protein